MPPDPVGTGAGAVLSAEIILAAYARGIFPMAEHRHAEEVFWVSPERRGIFPIGGFHISRSLARTLRRGAFRVTVDRAFAAVVDGCADRPETWINAAIRAVYLDLHDQGHAHSVEVWEGEALVGGVFGIAIGAAFFGESMFSRRTDASKVALAYLHDRLLTGGFRLFDTQFLTPHLASLGAVEIARAEYLRRLAAAVRAPARFDAQGAGVASAGSVIQRSAQTS